MNFDHLRDGDLPRNGGHPRAIYYPKRWLLAERISTILRGRDHLMNFDHLRDGDLARSGVSPRDGDHHRDDSRQIRQPVEW